MTFIRAEFVLEDPTTPGRGWLYRIICRADSLQEGRRRGLERLCEALGWYYSAALPFMFQAYPERSRLPQEWSPSTDSEGPSVGEVRGGNRKSPEALSR